MHTVWKGAISFGLVHVPIKMFTATEDKDVRFRSIHKECGMPISQKRVCSHCDKELEPGDIAKGFEYDRGKFVLFSEDELDALRPESARVIQILDFVHLTDIDPLYFEKAYYLAPDMAGASPYGLLMEAIKQTGKIGIAKISIRSKSRLAAIRVVDNCLCLETMHFPDEIRPISQVPNLPENVAVSDKELEIAKLLIDQLTETFSPEKYTDDYRIALLQAIEGKISGEGIDVVASPAEPAGGKVIDLMAALQASLEAVKIPTDSGKTATKRKAAPKEKKSKKTKETAS
ncbi:Ku protein [Paenibacillus sp. GCM10027627]|uniref:non-homologous end joining protein Ku n=1 Tax=unclassified Paenibacillus TaxID=185978 RepID=UPI0036411C1C